MKKIRYILVLVAISLIASSCSQEWLNINEDPNNPSNTVASVDSRLAWIQHHYLYAQMTAGTRTTYITQQNTYTTTTARDGRSAGWNPSSAISTTPYQWFFVVSAANFKDLEEKATKEEAWHYLGAVKAIKAAGFMLMTDWYGEMPYTEALGEAVTPKFDDGKTIFEGCLADIDKAIEYFNMTQPATATPLKKGDSWNDGDVQKWLKMCYGLKARWLNNLSKKSAMYNPDAILTALNNAPTSNADNTVVNHVDVASDNVGDVMWADPLMASIVFDNVGMNTNVRITKWYEDILTNFDNKGIEDPRADKLIPWAQFKQGKEFIRSKGVDMQSDIRLNKGPFPTTFNAKNEAITNNGRTIPAHAWYCNTSDPNRWGDTVYVSFRSSAIGYYGDTDDLYQWADGTIASTGTFYSRPDAPTHYLCYHEMCFIKAEVLFKKGDKTGAFNAYKEGIKAHIELMNQKLKTYGNVNPNKSPMNQADIDNFLNNAIGDATNVTLGKIMTQKYISMSFSQQNWNDMRRMDYSPNAYLGWDIPYEYYKTAEAQVSIPLGKQWRRIMQVSHEINYNSDNWAASHPHAKDNDIWSYPVWWDTAE
ncbi:MAG: SusD/RagB family nutrient-binding outer membrane lipoprotein [Petrimonas sp.]|nr:SusD/RagB family nutrient-binding outer membrane lipoprotein [Petrimonas sp.]